MEYKTLLSDFNNLLHSSGYANKVELLAEDISVNWKDNKYSTYWNLVMKKFNFKNKVESDVIEIGGKKFKLIILGPTDYSSMSGKYLYLLITVTSDTSGIITHFSIESDDKQTITKVMLSNVTLSSGNVMIVLPKEYVSIKHIMASIMSMGSEANRVSSNALVDNAERSKSLKKDPVVEIKEMWEIINTILDMVFLGSANGCIIGGTPGMGKTFTINQKLKSLGLIEGIDYVYFQGGKVTLIEFYRIMYENASATLIFDDSDSVFSHPDGVNMMKAALDSNPRRTVSYNSPAVLSKGLSTSFQFTGKMIFLTNLSLKEIDSAIRDRSLVMGVWLDREQIMADLKSKYMYVKSSEETSAEDDDSIKPIITREDKDRIYNWFNDYVKSNMEKGIDKPTQISMRLMKKMYDAYTDLKHTARNTGGTEEDAWNRFVKLMDTQFKMS
ncbi:TPA: hypothetical protein SFZ43_000115 [Campylobacter jejuni]|nr:hypothetical protein [Campylobacter jejuni]